LKAGTVRTPLHLHYICSSRKRNLWFEQGKVQKKNLQARLKDSSM